MSKKIEEYRQRASSAGILLTEPRAKKDKEAGVLAQTVKTMVQDWYKSHLYGRANTINSKYLEKGIVTEGDNLRYIGEEMGFGEMVLSTNQEQYEDEYFTGTPDIVLPNRIIDIKSSWDAYTFPLFMGVESVKKIYYAQLQVYMHLCGKENASLVYALGNTPENLVQQAIKYRLRDLEELGVTLTPEDANEIVAEVRAEHNYDKFGPELRIKRYNFTYDDAYIIELQNRVENVRKYLKEIKV